MVEAVPPGFGSDFGVALIAVSKTAGQALGNINTDLAAFAGRHFLSLGVQQVDIVQGNRLAHRADLMAVTDEIAYDQGAFGLTEALHNVQSRCLLELAEHLGVQGLAGNGGMLHRRKVKPGKILLNEHPVHSRRCAEGGDAVLGKERQDLLRIKAVKVINKVGSLAEPLSVELAPQSLCPAGIGDGQMQTLGVYLMPVFCGNKVSQRIFVIVGRQLGISRGAGGEEHQHGVRTAGGILCPGIAAAEHGIFLIKVVPTFPAAPHKDLMLKPRTFGGCFVHSVCHIAVGGAEDRLDLAGCKAVCKILFQKLIGGRDRHSTQLVQTQNSKPELVVPLQHQHHPVAPFDTNGLEEIGCPGRFLHHILEGEAPLGHILGHMEHSQLIRLLGAQSIHHIKGKVELLFVLEIDGSKLAVGDGRSNKLAIDPGFLFRQVLLDAGSCHRSCLLALTGSGVAQNDGVKSTVFTVHSDHAVGGGRIVVNTVAGVQHLGVSADLDAHMTPDDDVALLTLVGHQLDILIFRTDSVGDLHVKRQSDTVPEAGGKVEAYHVVCFLDALTVTLTGQGVGTKLGAFALQQVAHVHAEAQCTAVQESDA